MTTPETSIKASELRIGNYIYLSVNDGPLQVTGIINNWIHYQEEKASRMVNIEYCQPIPLTEEEWLLKAGFENIWPKCGYNYWKMQPFDGQRQFRFIPEDEGFAIQTVGSGFLWKLTHIKYVHQLQNLYFALTGEELMIKDK